VLCEACAATCRRMAFHFLARWKLTSESAWKHTWKHAWQNNRPTFTCYDQHKCTRCNTFLACAFGMCCKCTMQSDFVPSKRESAIKSEPILHACNHVHKMLTQVRHFAWHRRPCVAEPGQWICLSSGHGCRLDVPLRCCATNKRAVSSRCLS
jgi:hypothetical protein